MLDGYADVSDYIVFDVRHKNQVPDTSFDIYISSGGPGSPFDFEGDWDKAYFDLVEKLWRYNNDPSVENRKFVFFICHSFQLACQFFKIGEIMQRRSKSFGTFPCFKTEEGSKEPLFDALPNPFALQIFVIGRSLMPMNKL
ncbi:MAG: hypothetical protein HC817_14660 [Saprospiraceae bacterium]|nr:hypothetical protein [Saprospiraceae bacterium]